MPYKAIFLDRDGTLIDDPGYINHPGQIKLLDGAAEALIELRSLDYKLIVVSNQSAIARGILTEKLLDEIHDRLRQLLAEKGAYLDKIYYCPYHPDGAVAKYRKESDLRKPSPGMLLAAAKEMGIDLAQSWLLGNSSDDIEAGLRAGCRTILIDRLSTYKQPEPGRPSPDHKSVNIKEAVNIIKQYRRSPNKSANQIQQTPKVQIQQDLQPTEQPGEEQFAEPHETAMPEDAPCESTDQLLRSILEQLKSMQRTDMFSEFSIMRLIAGVVQIIVLLCLLICVWLLLAPNRHDNSVFIALGFGVLLQLMSLTFYIMQGRK